MSCEAFVISLLIEEGSPRKAFQEGITGDSFVEFEEEFQWLCERAETRKPINPRIFRKAFPDFEWIVPRERLQDLLDELKAEKAYGDISTAVEQVINELTVENAIEKAEFLKETMAEALHNHSPQSQVNLSSEWKTHLERQKQKMIMHEMGESFGIPTGIPNLDHHWGGLVKGRSYLILGRPGDAKSMLVAKFFIEAFLDGRNVVMLSPEMDEHDHWARCASLLTSHEGVQEDLGITRAFRNRALQEGHGYNYKTYKRLWEYVDGLPGNMHLLTQKYRRTKMTPAFVESRIDELGAELVIVDPIYKLKSPSKRQLKHEEIQDLMDALTDIGKGFDVPMVITNQAHRQGGNKGDAPHKDNSFGSDAPVQEADHVIGVKHLEDEKKLLLRCTKSRWGRNFRVDCAFHPNIGVIRDLTPIRGDYFNGHEEEEIDKVREMISEVEKEAVESGRE